MLDKHGQRYGESHKFADALAEYAYENYAMQRDPGDDYASDGQGNSLARYGRRILEECDNGFVQMWKESTEDDAETVILNASEAWTDWQ